MTNLKSLITTGILAGSLVLGGCGNNKKYQDFTHFIIKEGKREQDPDFYHIHFLKGNKLYQVEYNPAKNIFLPEVIRINIYNNKENIEECVVETFRDVSLDGLEHHSLKFEDLYYEDHSLYLLQLSFFQTKRNKEKYEMLIDSIPKWYEESKTLNLSKEINKK